MNNEIILKVTFERKEVSLLSVSKDNLQTLENYLTNYLISAYENFDRSQVELLQKMLKEINVAKKQ